MAAIYGVMLCLSCGVVNAQGADVFAPKDSSEKAKGDSSGEVTPLKPVDSEPSRFAGKEIVSYVAARAAVFSMRNRETDPFGLYQDPNVKPAMKTLPSQLPSRRQAALPPVPLADIIKLIRVTTIMPGEKMFLVGVRKFKEGSEFPLNYGGKTMRMKVLEVSSSRIVFKDLDKNEEAALLTGILPAGMVPGGEEMTPPGMVSPTENAPLQLEASLPSDDR